MIARGYVCRKCNEEFNGKVQQCNWLCGKCKNKDPIFYLQRKLETSLKKEEISELERADLARLVMQKCKAKSVLSGVDDPRQLCMIRVDPKKPWCLDNAVLVTSEERKSALQQIKKS